MSFLRFDARPPSPSPGSTWWHQQDGGTQILFYFSPMGQIFSFLMALWYLKCHGNVEAWLYKLGWGSVCVCLLAQIRFEKWLEGDCRFVGKQCALLFSGSVAFNQCNAGGCWEKETVAREMEGESESMISPSACFSSVSCRSSDPFVMLSHGEIWLGSLPSSQNWHGESKGWGLCCSSLWMDHINSIVTIRSVWPSAEALPI